MRTTAHGSYLDSVIARFERSATDNRMRYAVGTPVDQRQIADASALLGVAIPIELAVFYLRADGLTVEDPGFEFLPLSRLSFLAPERLHFATIDNRHRLCFDTSELNEAGQWNLFELDSDYAFTKTLGSFWANKVWKWLDEREAFWRPWPFRPDS